MFVSVILPAYMEQRNLEVLIPKICKNIEGYEGEVIVVDDNSPDDTCTVIKNMEASDLPVRLILRKEDKGFAKSIRAGIEASEAEYVLIMDSDGNHDTKYIPFMLSNTKFYPCVLASRFQYKGGMSSPARQILSFLFNTFVRVCTGGFITDCLYGFFIIKRSELNKCRFDDIFWGYGDYAIRLFYYLQKSRVDILQFPARNAKRISGNGNSRFFRVFVQYFGATLKLLWKEKFKYGPRNS